MGKKIKLIIFIFTAVLLTACTSNPKDSEVFNPNTDSEDNYVWMEGTVKMWSFEEKDEMYYVLVKPNENSVDEYRSMIISFDKDVKITKNKKTISIDDFQKNHDESDLKFATYMDEKVGAELRTGVVTDIILLEE